MRRNTGGFAAKTAAVGSGQNYLFQMSCWALLWGGACTPGAMRVWGGGQCMKITLLLDLFCVHSLNLAPCCFLWRPFITVSPTTFSNYQRVSTFWRRWSSRTPLMMAAVRSPWMFNTPVPPDHPICLGPFQKGARTVFYF